MKLEPVALLYQHDETGRTTVVDPGQNTIQWEEDNPRWRFVHALYAIPDGYVVVPVELIKEARRIIARAYADGNSASIRHYNCMTALDRLVDWKDGEECILPDEPR